MKTKHFLMLLAVVGVSLFSTRFLAGQDQISGVIKGGDKIPRIAVPDFRGKGAAQPLMSTFNEVLWDDLEASGALAMVAKTYYPLEVPQSAAEFRPPTTEGGRPKKNGPWLTDWSQPPVSTGYLAIGNADVNAAGLLVQGWLLNVGERDVRAAQRFTNPYVGTANEAGARNVAHQFAADILSNLGIPTLAGSKIYFVSDRTGKQEIWSMDHDGGNQTLMTRNNTITFMPAVSQDGKLVAYTTNTKDTWAIRVVQTATNRQQTFVNPVTSTISTPAFSPDGKKLWFSMVINDYTQIVTSNVDGGQMQRVSKNRAIELSAKVNPKNPQEVIFISDRTGHTQLYRMNADGGGVEMISNGQGEVHNPAWSPDGTKIAFQWNKGFVAGDFNIFIQDLANKTLVQLTHESGTNENPSWAPDGIHLVYSNQKGRSTQIYSILANGTRVKQLTSQGSTNKQPVWAVGTTN
ncbi:MAG: DUF5050 domain-containing protein [Acidobacteriota bacterium]